MPDHYLRHEGIDQLLVVPVEDGHELSAMYARSGWSEVDPPAVDEPDTAPTPPKRAHHVPATTVAEPIPEQAPAPLDTSKE